MAAQRVSPCLPPPPPPPPPPIAVLPRASSFEIKRSRCRFFSRDQQRRAATLARYITTTTRTRRRRRNVTLEGDKRTSCASCLRRRTKFQLFLRSAIATGRLLPAYRYLSQSVPLGLHRGAITDKY